MLSFALNHMTVLSLSMMQTGALARVLGMDGVELRNDLDGPLFDGLDPSPAMLGGLDVFALAEVKAFNAFDDQTFNDAVALMDLAVGCGARAIALIPQVGGAPVPQDGLRTAMISLGPELQKRALTGLIEPIGFQNSTLRHKADVVALIDTLDFGGSFGIIHDTFHHRMVDQEAFYPTHTKMVHISGVTDPQVDVTTVTDADRVLVDADDRFGNIDQINTLIQGGYTGPFSFEAFSPDVHALADPEGPLSQSIRFIKNSVTAHAA